MKFSELPEGTEFFDIDGKAVAVLPDATHIAFELKGSNESRPFPPPSQRASGSDMGDRLPRDEFEAWLKNGFNRFDVRPPAPT